MDAREPVVILITFPTDGNVMAFARALVHEGAAACVTVLPEGESVYRWEGAIEQARERQLIVKTTCDMVDLLRRRVGDLHPYDTPEFLVLRVAGGRSGTWRGSGTRWARTARRRQKADVRNQKRNDGALPRAVVRPDGGRGSSGFLLTSGF